MERDFGMQMEKQIEKGIRNAENKAPQGKGLINKKIRRHTKRHVNKQWHITDAEARFILHHSGNAIEPRRRKTVGNDKKLIVKRK